MPSFKDWFTSDTHFGHKNIIIYCSRPFRDVEEMDRELIARWNARVTPEDHVYHLGDFAMASKVRIAEIRKALNGRITLILGNHDRSAKAMMECGFDEVAEMGILPIGKGLEAVLHHEPLLDYDPDRFHVHFCGHVHEKWASRRGDKDAMIINVGVDQNDYQPISLAEAMQRHRRPSVFAGTLLKCRVCPRTVARAEFFIDGCPKCGARETEPFVYEDES